MRLSLLLSPRRRVVGPVLLALTALVVPLGCGGDEETKDASAPGGSVSSTVDVDGSSTVFRISDAAREAFEKVDSKINVVVGNHGTGGGFGRYLKGEVDVVDASRAAKPEEETKAKAQGIDWTRFLVGYDGIAVVVNKKNTFVKTLSVADLKKIFGSEGTAKTWKDVNPAWPDRKIIVYTPDKDSGTFEFFVEAILGKAGKQRADIQASPDDNFLVKGVAGDDDGIGYFGFAYYASNASVLNAVAVKAGDESPAIEPNPETILKKTYAPLSRPLYIYVKKTAMRRAAVASFVKYYLDNIGTLATKAGYVSPTEEDQSVNRMALPTAGGPST